MQNYYSLFCFGSIAIVIFSVGILLGFLIRTGYRSRIRLRQNQGEASVRKLIISSFYAPHYHLLNNITIPFEDGTSQIDHILISTKGIFIIETKHYSGWIFANAKSKYWTQVMYRVKNQFQNPLHQNYKHLKAIENLLDFLPNEQIHSMVVFSGSATFKSPIPKGVLYLNQLANHINTYQEDVISENRLQFCVGRLECKRYEVTRKTDIHHQAYLAKKFGN